MPYRFRSYPPSIPCWNLIKFDAMRVPNGDYWVSRPEYSGPVVGVLLGVICRRNTKSTPPSPTSARPGSTRSVSVPSDADQRPQTMQTNEQRDPSSGGTLAGAAITARSSSCTSTRRSAGRDAASSSIVMALLLCRKICMTTRGYTSSAASRLCLLAAARPGWRTELVIWDLRPLSIVVSQ